MDETRREYRRRWMAKRRRDIAYRSREREADREARREKRRGERLRNPEAHAQKLARDRAQYRNDPEYRAKRLAASRRQARKKPLGPRQSEARGGAAEREHAIRRRSQPKQV